jgi:transcriptional regulator with XRE-family HTH domain
LETRTGLKDYRAPKYWIWHNPGKPLGSSQPFIAVRSGERLAEQTPIAARIAHLIDQREGGNVAAAARRLGVSQRGLAKVYAGETRHPRADLLQALVREYGADPAWLLTGIPAEEWPESSQLSAASGVRLPDELLDALRKVWPDLVSRIRREAEPS